MYRSITFAAVMFIPGVAAAQGVQELILGLISFINATLIPLLFALAFLFFITNIVRYFILDGANSEKQKSARQFAIWGIIAMVVMLIFWGMINLLVSGLGLNRSTYVCPDYLPPSACPVGPTDSYELEEPEKVPGDSEFVGPDDWYELEDPENVPGETDSWWDRLFMLDRA